MTKKSCVSKQSTAFFLLILLNLAALTIFSCVAPPYSTNIVLEKSPGEQPDWLSGEYSAQNPLSADTVPLVYKRSDIRNLPLGIKQSQLVGLKLVKLLVKQKLEKDLRSQLPAFFQDKNPDRLNRLVALTDNAIDENLQRVKFTPLYSQSIYWEHRQRGSEDGPKKYYVVWVLLPISKKDYDKSFKAISQQIIKNMQTEPTKRTEQTTGRTCKKDSAHETETKR